MNQAQTELGLLEWFHIGEYERVEATIKEMSRLPFKRLRTGISWADYHQPEGRKWIDWLIPRLTSEFELLPCFIYTPPSLGIVPKTSSPLRNPKDFADFLDDIIGRHGTHFENVELWNEPNNLSEYDFTLDHDWEKFCEMMGAAAFWMKKLGKKTVLGGMSPVDPNWLRLMYSRGLMEYIDVIGIHHFPGVFDTRSENWPSTVKKVKDIVEENQAAQKIWITETGYPTVHHREFEQLSHFMECLDAPVERVYWYGLKDLHEKHPTVDGFHLDEREYAFGMIGKDEKPKLLYHELTREPIPTWTARYKRWTRHMPPDGQALDKPYALLVGDFCEEQFGLAENLLQEKIPVALYDLPADQNAIDRLEMLINHFGTGVRLFLADIRNRCC